MKDIKKKTLELTLELQTKSKEADQYPYGTKNVQRLSRRSIAEIAEDMFAKYLYETLEDREVRIYVNGNLKGMKPDIIVVKNNVVIAIVELKINFGWCRNIFDPLENNQYKYKERSIIPKRIEEYQSLKEKIIHFKIKKNESLELLVSKHSKVYYICTSEENYISKRSVREDYEDFMKRNSNLKEKLRFGILVREYHDYKGNNLWTTKKEIEISINELFKTKYGMNRIIEEIKKAL